MIKRMLNIIHITINIRIEADDYMDFFMAVLLSKEVLFIYIY